MWGARAKPGTHCQESLAPVLTLSQGAVESSSMTKENLSPWSPFGHRKEKPGLKEEECDPLRKQERLSAFSFLSYTPLEAPTLGTSLRKSPGIIPQNFPSDLH